MSGGMRRAERAVLLAALLFLGACAVVKVPVKVGGTAVGTAILVTTRDSHDLPGGTRAGVRH